MKVIPILKLVKSMTPHELHLLRKKSSHRQAAYIGLLDMYSQTDIKSESKVKALFQAQFPLVDFSETKSFLYKFLLKGLTELNAQQSVFSSLYFDLITVDVLKARGLNVEANGLLKQIGNTAKKENYDLIYASSLRAQKLIQLKLANTAKDYTALELIHQEEKNALVREEEYAEALILYARLMPLLHQGVPHDSPVVVRQLQQLMKHPLVKNRHSLTSQNARLVMFDFMTNYYVFVGRDDLAHKACKDWVDNVVDLSNAIDYMIYRYIFTVHNLATMASTKRELQRYADKLKKVRPAGFDNVMYQKLFSYELDMDLAMRWKANLALDWRELEAFSQSDFLKNKRSYQLMFLRVAAACGLAKGQLGYCENFCIQILRESSNDKHYTVSAIDARLIYLALLFEQQRYVEMSSQLRTLVYYAAKNKIKSKLAPVLKFFSYLSQGKLDIAAKFNGEFWEDVALHEENYTQFYHSGWLNKFKK